jgi:hypothetical protein
MVYKDKFATDFEDAGLGMAFWASKTTLQISYSRALYSNLEADIETFMQGINQQCGRAILA